jgi:hypothetical protein
MKLNRFTNRGYCTVCWNEHTKGAADSGLTGQWPCPSCGLPAHAECSSMTTLMDPHERSGPWLIIGSLDLSPSNHVVVCTNCTEPDT